MPFRTDAAVKADSTTEKGLSNSVSIRDLASDRVGDESCDVCKFGTTNPFL